MIVFLVRFFFLVRNKIPECPSIISTEHQLSLICLIIRREKKNVTNIDEEKRRQFKIVKRQGEMKNEQSQGEYQSTP